MTAVIGSMLSFEPSLRIVAVDDDNINYSDEAPLHDQIRRVTPELALRFESPRFSARTSYSMDHETYSHNPALDDERARERAGISFHYVATERLTLGASAGWMTTNTLTDLNTHTGLPSSRLRAERTSFGPTARFRMSPRMTATAAHSSTRTVTDRESISAQAQTAAIERRITSRDSFTITYERSRFEFEAGARLRMMTQSLAGRWTRDIGAHSQVSIQAGPRFTDGVAALDFAASATHEWNDISIGATLQRNQTVLVGYPGLVDAERLESRLSWTPNRRLAIYVSPAVFRTAHEALEGIVYRIGAGARYAITPLLALDVAYGAESQNGAIDPLRSDLRLSHRVVSIGLSVIPRNAE